MLARSNFRLSPLSLVAAASVTLASLAISGCASGIIADTSSVAPVGAVSFEGKALGGSTPITGATVNIWETDPNSQGYPSSSNEYAKILGTTTTGDGSTTINGSVPQPGAWSISSINSCDTATAGTAGPFVYVTVTGGNTGAGVNKNSVLIAALGACSAVFANKATLHITVNESSTIAAAYALGNFMYVDNTTPGSQNVYIGADASNNAITGSCGVSGATAGPQGPTGVKCAAAGLSHAFANAFNLGADANIGSQAIGQAQPTIQPNPFTGTGAVSYSSVPVAELNTLSNLLATCVNSAGGTTSGSNCANLFALTTNAAGTAPTDTLTAAINIAQNPGHNVGSALATGLYQLVTTSGPYQPTLTTYPHDWSVGIAYTAPTPSATVTGFVYNYTTGNANGTIAVTASNTFAAGESIALNGFTNANDTPLNGAIVTVTAASGTTFSGTTTYTPASGMTETLTSSPGDTGIASLPTQAEAVALDPNDNVYAPFLTTAAGGLLTSFTSSGTTNWMTSLSPNLCGAFNIATDTANNVWTTNYVSSSFCTASTYGVYGFSQTSGAATYSLTSASNKVLSAPWAIAIDANNNIWYGRKSSTCGTTSPNVCVGEMINTSGTYGNASTSLTFGSGSTASISVGSGVIHLLPDFNQDIWVGSYEPGTGTTWYPTAWIPNSGTTGNPAYTSVYEPASSATETYGLLAIDSNYYLWTGGGQSGSSDLLYYNPTTETAVGPAATKYTTTTNSAFNPSKPLAGEFDGNNRLFFVSQTSSGQVWYYSQAYNTAGDAAAVIANDIVPCYLPSGSATCAATPASGYPNMLQIDSTGSIWVAAGSASFGTVTTTPGYLIQIIGTAAPTWPQLTYAQFAVKP